MSSSAALRILLPGAFLLALAAGCAAPGRAIPNERVTVGGRAYAYGRARLAGGGERAEVLEIKRAGLREDASIFVRLAEGRLEAIEVVEAGRTVPRAPLLNEVEEAADLLSERNQAWATRLRAWIAARTDLGALCAALERERDARRDAEEGLLGVLADAYRDERESVELREREARARNTWFLGLFGWQRGAYSGYSWSFPFHLERYDASEGLRELAIFPLLSGGRREHGGTQVLSVPLLAYYGRVETPYDRTGGFLLAGFGATYRDSIAGRARTTWLLPLLAIRRTGRGEDFADDGGRLLPGERTDTHALASLVYVGSETPGIYRDSGALKTVGRDRASWRVLPLASYERDERGHETMLWPLLGFGFGSEDGRRYVRLFYFLKIGGAK